MPDDGVHAEQLVVEAAQRVTHGEQSARIDDEPGHGREYRVRQVARVVTGGMDQAVPGAQSPSVRLSPHRCAWYFDTYAGAPEDLELRLGREDATVGDLLDALPDATQARGIVVDGRFCHVDLALTEIGLYEGARIQPAERRPRGAWSRRADGPRAARHRRLRRR